MRYLVFSTNSETLNNLLQQVEPKETFILQNNLQSALACFKDNTFEKICLHFPNVEEINQTLSHALYSILKPDGILIVSHESESKQVQDLKERFTIGGFKIDNKEENNSVALRKPGWAGKGVASLKKKAVETNGQTSIKVENPSDNTKKSNPFAKVVINNNNNELIDEDNLLSGESEYKKLEKPEDCSTKPKACKNCSCGRAEQEY